MSFPILLMDITNDKDVDDCLEGNLLAVMGGSIHQPSEFTSACCEICADVGKAEVCFSGNAVLCQFGIVLQCGTQVALCALQACVYLIEALV